MLIRIYNSLKVADGIKAYSVAILCIAVAVVVRFSFESLVDRPVQFLVMAPAILMAAVFAGVGPGLLAVALATWSAWFFVGAITMPPPIYSYALFVIGGLLQVWIAWTARYACRRTEEWAWERDKAASEAIRMAQERDAALKQEAEARERERRALLDLSHIVGNVAQICEVGRRYPHVKAQALDDIGRLVDLPASIEKTVKKSAAERKTSHLKRVA